MNITKNKVNFRKSILIMAVILCILISFVSADSYKITDKKTYIIRNAYEVINDSKSPVYDLLIKVLVGANTDSLYQNLLDIQVEPGGFHMESDDWGNIYAKYNIAMLKPNSKISITIENTIENSGVSFDKKLYHKDADYSKFLKVPSNYIHILPGEKIESNAMEIKEKALELTKSGTVMEKAKRIYDFVNLHIEYDESPLYANKGALNGLRTKRGVCDEYAFLFTALCRAAGLPSRVIAGYWVEDHIKENLTFDISSDRHSWSEFYIPDIGWIPAEPTFRYIYNGKKIPNEDYFANISSDDRHFISSYITKDIKKDLDVQYSHYGVDTVSLKLISKDESIKLLPKDYKHTTKYALYDIKEDYWAAPYIISLYNEGIIYAKEGSLFKPYDNINRAEFAAYITNALGLDKTKASGEYKDVTAQTKFYEYINAATKAGLIEGYNGYYNPNDSITRQDISVVMKRAIDYLNIKEEASKFPDYKDKSSISDYAIDSIRLMHKLNIMQGKPGFIFAPKDFTSRGEAAKIIWEFRKNIFQK